MIMIIIKSFPRAVTNKNENKAMEGKGIKGIKKKHKELIFSDKPLLLSGCVCVRGGSKHGRNVCSTMVVK